MHKSLGDDLLMCAAMQRQNLNNHPVKLNYRGAIPKG